MDSIPITIHARDVYVKLILNEVKVTTFPDYTSHGLTAHKYPLLNGSENTYQNVVAI